MNTSNEILTEEVKWSSLKKFLFLFVFFYSFFYIFPSPLNEIPGVAAIFKYYDKTFGFFIMFVGHHLLHLPNLTKIELTGSGDTTYDYVRVLSIFLLAGFLSIVIFIIDRKRKNYRKLFYLLYVSIRYYLAIYMLIYGFAKVFKLQFPNPSLFGLEERYGNSSPMHLLWTFMGASTGYTVFAGLGEVLGGLLLLFRRTVILGAFISLLVLANVAAMNFFYDVDVKLFSFHLVLFSIFILAPDLKTFYAFFILRKSVMLEHNNIIFKAKWFRITRIVLKSVVFLIVIGIGVTCYLEKIENGDNAPKPPMYGIYETKLFVRNHDTLKPLTTDTLRWNKLVIDKSKTYIGFMDEVVSYYKFKADTVKKIMEFTSYRDNSILSHFSYTFSKDTLVMSGVWKKDTLYVMLKRKDPNKFLLVNRGFHWINEQAFNH